MLNFCPSPEGSGVHVCLLETFLIEKLLILAKNIYGKYPQSFATARIKYCLKVLKKIPVAPFILQNTSF